MPVSVRQYEVVKQQVNSFKELGYLAILDIQPQQQDGAPHVVLVRSDEHYKFSDPDWFVVSRQLAELYRHKRCSLV